MPESKATIPLALIPNESVPASTAHRSQNDQASQMSPHPRATTSASQRRDAGDVAAHGQPGPVDSVAAPDQPASRPQLQTAVVMTSLCACVFLAAMDVTIISPVLPVIAAEFHSASGYQWVATAYVLGSTATSPSWGKVSDIWGRRPILLLAILIFFAGSLICALGKNMTVFLAGRAIQGVGASGLLTLVNIAISDLFSLRERGLYYGVTSVVWAIASGVGPVLGGTFAQELSWRWCFWMNLPVSVVVFVFLMFAMPNQKPGVSVWAGLRDVDWSGSLLIVAGTLMLLLGLHFGGVTFPWNSATVINLIMFGVFAGFLFSLNEWKLVRYPVMPPRIFRSRSSAGSFVVCFCHGFVMMGIAYYLPLYFQAVLGAGPLLSGVYLLPFIVAEPLFAAATGVYIQWTGKYMPSVYLGLILMTLGMGLLVDLDMDFNWGKIVMFQIIVGAGVGLNFEGPLLAVQAALKVEDVSLATATISFVRMLSMAISAVVGGVVFQNQMAQESAGFSDLPEDLVRRFQGDEAAASVELIDTLGPEQQSVVRAAFHQSLKMMWIMYTIFAGVAIVAGCFIKAHHLSNERPDLREDAARSPDARQNT